MDPIREVLAFVQANLYYQIIGNAIVTQSKPYNPYPQWGGSVH